MKQTSFSEVEFAGKKKRTRRIFDEIKAHLADKGLTMREGTIVDATLIAALPSTKNRDGERDPEMHQSKKGDDWHFGMKAHVGVDMATGLVYTVVGNVAKREENVGKDIAWHTAMRHGKRKTLKKNPLGRAIEKLEKTKASVRAKVEHCAVVHTVCTG